MHGRRRKRLHDEATSRDRNRALATKPRCAAEIADAFTTTRRTATDFLIATSSKGAMATLSLDRDQLEGGHDHPFS